MKIRGKKYKREQAVFRKVKKSYGSCAITGIEMPLVGSHIFPKGAYPQFQFVEENILPVLAAIDMKIEYKTGATFIKRPPFARILWIWRAVHRYNSPNKEKVLNQLQILRRMLREYKVIHGGYR